MVDKHVRTVDLLPTIADALDVEIPWRTDGESGFAPGEGSDTVKVGFGPLSRSFDAALEQRGASLRRQLEPLRLGKLGQRILRRRPVREPARTAGRRPSVSSGGGEARIDRIGSRFLRDLRPRSPLVPSPLAGTLNGAERGDDLAVAVNGRIQAVATAYREDDGPVRFIALAPESAFHAGRNSVRVFVVSGRPPARACASSGRRFRSRRVAARDQPLERSSSRSPFSRRGCCRPRAASRPGGRDRR